VSWAIASAGTPTARSGVKTPVPNPTSCCFGGPDLTDLYVTTAWLRLGDEERQAAPGSGDLFGVHTDISGLPEPKLSG
jgi:sugar lactone lactonase YvrE